MRKLFIAALLLSNTLFGQDNEIDLTFQLGSADHYVYSHKGSEDYLVLFGGWNPYNLYTIGLQFSGYADGYRKKWTLNSFEIAYSSMNVHFEDPYGYRYYEPRSGVAIRDLKTISSHSYIMSASWIPSYYQRLRRARHSQTDLFGGIVLGMKSRYKHEYTIDPFDPHFVFTKESYYGETFELNGGCQVGVRYSYALSGHIRIVSALEFPVIFSKAFWLDTKDESKSNLSYGYFRFRCGIAF